MKFIFSFLSVFFFTQVLAGKITGRVTDEQGAPLPYATILVSHEKQGVTANLEGYYSITLAPGVYTIQCRYVGYQTVEQIVTTGDDTIHLNFSLKQLQLELAEIVIDPNAEDPAYEIIRNAIKKRPYYDDEVNSFTADVYIKGLVRLLKLPGTFMGRKVDLKDMEDVGIDSTGKGIIYLAESLTKVSEQKPNQMKMEVISSRVSGSDGFGFDFPIFISFYKNIVNVSKGAFTRRGFVSPIADNALRFYKYKLLGSYFENGTHTHSIKVIPRRKYEPLFSGVINITDDDWRISSCRLLLTVESQLQILDTIEISQIHSPETDDIWRVKNQLLRFSFKEFGVEAEGEFVNVYGNYNLEPHFSKKYFDNIVIQYDTGANKRTDAYWEHIRPVPLEKDEEEDFQKKTSLKGAMDSLMNARDSARKSQRFPGAADFLLNDATWKIRRGARPVSMKLEGLLKGLQYNTVEGVSVNPSMVFSGYVPSAKTTFQIIADARYGFTNKQWNPWAGIVITDRLKPDVVNKFRNYEAFLAGGKRLSQFFKMSSLDGLNSSVSTLLYGWNNMKLYENVFFKASFKKIWENGNQFRIEGVFEDRVPLENSTDFIWNNKWKDRLTPNYPTAITDRPFEPHKALVIHGSFSFQPGQRYIQYPKSKVSLGSKYPVFTIHYYKGLSGLFGSDVNFDQWNIDMAGQISMPLTGRFKYRLNPGGFLNRKKVFVQDYRHYYGTYSHVADEYLKAFQYTWMYEYSNDAPFYTALYFEHHGDGLITNKIPFLKKLNWHIVEGVNALYIPGEVRHLEVFAGLENIFKMFRFDVLLRIDNNHQSGFVYRIGFGGLIGDVANVLRFTRHSKIIDPW